MAYVIVLIVSVVRELEAMKRHSPLPHPVLTGRRRVRVYVAANGRTLATDGVVS